MKTGTLETLFHDSLRDIYYAERKILKSMPKMARAIQSPEVREAMEKHRVETEGQIERIQQIFEMLGKRAQAKTCPAIDGIIEEAEEILESYGDSPALDAGIVASVQAVEHYEIARYGTLKSWAQALGMKDAQALIEQSLAEETATDKLMSKLATASVNPMAAKAA